MPEDLGDLPDRPKFNPFEPAIVDLVGRERTIRVSMQGPAPRPLPRADRQSGRLCWSKQAIQKAVDFC